MLEQLTSGGEGGGAPQKENPGPQNAPPPPQPPAAEESEAAEASDGAELCIIQGPRGFGQGTYTRAPLLGVREAPSGIGHVIGPWNVHRRALPGEQCDGPAQEGVPAI